MSATGDKVSGVRAARLRRGLSQRQLAELMQRPLNTVQNWDRGHNRPSDPAVLQLLSRVLETPLDGLFDPEENPQVARVLLELDDHDVGHIDSAGPDVEPPGRDGRERDPRATPAAAAAEPTVVAPAVRVANWKRRRLVRAAVLAAGITAAVVVVVIVSGHDDRAEPVARDTPPAGVVSPNQEARVAMNAAADRGDWDRAIQGAGRIGDERAASGYRSSAAAVLVRRAAKAASRGDLTLARQRLRSARKRYGSAPGSDAVTRRIRRIERDRRRRAAEQRQRARRQAAAPTAPAPAVAPSPTPAAPTTPSAPAPRPTPTPPSGSTRTPSREREQAVDPGLF